jgi:phage tail protein X
MSTQTEKVPQMAAVRFGKLEPVVQKWRDAHPGVPLSRLLRKGLKLALRDVAGKRYAELVEGN